MMRPVLLGLAAAVVVTAGGACSSGSGTSSPQGTRGTQALWVAPTSLDALADTHFYDHPWPSDVRLDADGTIHVAGFYNPHLVPLLDTYVSETKGLLHGFSPTASMYLRFTGDIDPSTLPADPPHAALSTSTVQLVNVDPKSPEH